MKRVCHILQFVSYFCNCNCGYLFFKIGVFLQLNAPIDASLAAVGVVGAHRAVCVILEALLALLQKLLLVLVDVFSGALQQKTLLMEAWWCGGTYYIKNQLPQIHH